MWRSERCHFSRHDWPWNTTPQPSRDASVKIFWTCAGGWKTNPVRRASSDVHYFRVCSNNPVNGICCAPRRPFRTLCVTCCWSRSRSRFKRPNGIVTTNVPNSNSACWNGTSSFARIRPFNVRNPFCSLSWSGKPCPSLGPTFYQKYDRLLGFCFVHQPSRQQSNTSASGLRISTSLSRRALIQSSRYWNKTYRQEIVRFFICLTTSVKAHGTVVNPNGRTMYMNLVPPTWKHSNVWSVLFYRYMIGKELTSVSIKKVIITYTAYILSLGRHLCSHRLGRRLLRREVLRLTFPLRKRYRRWLKALLRICRRKESLRCSCFLQERLFLIRMPLIY